MNCPFCNNLMTVSHAKCEHCSTAYPNVHQVQIYFSLGYRDIFLDDYNIALDVKGNRTIIEDAHKGGSVLVINSLLPITPASAQAWCDKLLKLKAFS